MCTDEVNYKEGYKPFECLNISELTNYSKSWYTDDDLMDRKYLLIITRLDYPLFCIFFFILSQCAPFIQPLYKLIF
jgi:hypothetical protein